MSITSQITGVSIFGSNPSGFVPLVPNQDGNAEYISSTTLNREYQYADLTFVTGDIPATQDNFLDMVKTDIDTNYLPSVFTDSTKSYTAQINVNSVKLDFITQTGDRGIWTERQYKWFVGVTVKVNVD